MSLNALTWKMLPEYIMPRSSSGVFVNDVVSILNGVYTIFSSTTYHDGSTRLTGSVVSGSTGWQFLKSGSGTVTNVVYGYPPILTTTSQSVIFAGGSTGSVSASSFQYAGVQFGSTVGDVYNTNQLYFGMSKGSGIYKYFANTSPMETGSNVTNSSTSSFSGYLKSGISASIYKMRAWESKEAIAMQFYESTNGECSSITMGAILDPESAVFGGESDGRIYGIVGNTGTRMSVNWLSTSESTSSRFLHTDFGVTSSKMLYFVPNSNTMGGAQMATIYQMSSSFISDIFNFLPRLPLFYKDYVSGRWVGRLREIQVIKNAQAGTIFKSGGTIIGYGLGSSEWKSNNCVFLSS